MNFSHRSQQYFFAALMAISSTAMVLAIVFPLLAPLLPYIPASGHSHVHAHGHAFIDARSYFGIPNCLDVISNIPFLLAGVWGLLLLRHHTLANATHTAAQIFFFGLVLTFFGSSFYHWSPSDFGLMIDRIGMAVAFTGVISFASASRLGDSAAKLAMPVLMVVASLSAIAAYSLQNVLPWAVVQFGGMVMIAWLAALPQREGDHLNIWALIAWYTLAKILEAGDEAVFHLTLGHVSGHSLKHIAACLAAWPVISALKKT
jgi:hypothetical protein